MQDDQRPMGAVTGSKACSTMGRTRSKKYVRRLGALPVVLGV
jgi:hypothetical protein